MTSYEAELLGVSSEAILQSRLRFEDNLPITVKVLVSGKSIHRSICGSRLILPTKYNVSPFRTVSVDNVDNTTRNSPPPIDRSVVVTCNL